MLNSRVSKLTAILWLANVVPYAIQGIRTGFDGQLWLATSSFLLLSGFLAAIVLLTRISLVGAIFSLSLAGLVAYRMSDAVLNPGWDLPFRLSHAGMIALAALFALAAALDSFRRRGAGLPQRPP